MQSRGWRLADSGPGSLRDAVLSANLAVGPDQAVFEPGLSGTITLTSGEITITGPLVIDGPGATVLTVSGGNQSRVFVVNDGAAGVMDVTLSGLTLTQGNALGSGKAVLAVAEDLTIQDSVLTNSISNALGPGTACGGSGSPDRRQHIDRRSFPNREPGARRAARRDRIVAAADLGLHVDEDAKPA